MRSGETMREHTQRKRRNRAHWVRDRRMSVSERAGQLPRTGRPRRRRRAARRLLRRARRTRRCRRSASRSAPPGTAAPRTARTFNEAHVLAISRGDLPLPRGSRASTARCSSARDTHALSEPAAQHDRRGALPPTASTSMVDADDGYTPTPVDLARDPHPQPRRRPRHRRRDRRHARRTTRPRTAASSTTRRTAGRPTPTSPAGSSARPTRCSRTGCATSSARRDRDERPPPRLRDGLRRRPARRDRPRRDPRRRAAPRRRPARRRERRLLGRRSPSATGSTSTIVNDAGRPDLPLRAARLGRQDPHGLLLAVRDGAAARAARPLRRRLRQRPRRRPPRDRHAGRRAAEPQPPPRGVHRATCSAARRDWGAGRRRSARRSSRARSSTASPPTSAAALVEVPVGFKWFVDGLLDGTLGFGGEESAGASFLRRDGAPWSTDKDGLIPCLLAAEMTATTGDDPGELYAALTERFGRAVLPAHRRRGRRRSRRPCSRKLSRRAGRPASELAGEPITRGAHRGARQRRADRRPEGRRRARLVRRAARRAPRTSTRSTPRASRARSTSSGSSPRPRRSSAQALGGGG